MCKVLQIHVAGLSAKPDEGSHGAVIYVPKFSHLVCWHVLCQMPLC